ncbi:MAG: hypothetical protein WC241_03100 [Candidatus Paceibacterota bacterium]|jgi:Tfp pilus assembly protein PilE
MKNNNQKIEYNKGYAILFTVVVVGIISMITIGLSNAAYKQIILSSVAKDSTTAFYESDIASECALYADNTYNMAPPNPWTCAGNTLTFPAGTSVGGTTNYSIDPSGTNGTSIDKCFRVTATKTIVLDTITTNIQAKGYNICNMNNSRTVERAIEINY